jgi:NAD(P)-dependent dehydrogenase (short-subunit alcohol dehydrogenase family)
VPRTDSAAPSLSLASEEAELVLHGRRSGALADIARAVATTSGRQPRTVLADFADLDQVRAMAAEVRDSVDSLDVLVNNAGIGAAQPESTSRSTTPDGVELRFDINYLASALLTLELLPHRPAPARLRRPDTRTPLQRHARLRTKQIGDDHVRL